MFRFEPQMRPQTAVAGDLGESCADLMRQSSRAPLPLTPNKLFEARLEASYCNYAAFREQRSSQPVAVAARARLDSPEGVRSSKEQCSPNGKRLLDAIDRHVEQASERVTSGVYFSETSPHHSWLSEAESDSADSRNFQDLHWSAHTTSARAQLSTGVSCARVCTGRSEEECDLYEEQGRVMGLVCGDLRPGFVKQSLQAA